jgi:hypothetical protein
MTKIIKTTPIIILVTMWWVGYKNIAIAAPNKLIDPNITVTYVIFAAKNCTRIKYITLTTAAIIIPCLIVSRELKNDVLFCKFVF